ncbi:hypothetical protein [Priestia flexa]|uniref:hypothetical protein n=1 Tax=Priestia flexa TaxID=86664 RepID=UPI00047373DE|nr:hypothetical protein [Priestia flexa]
MREYEIKVNSNHVKEEQDRFIKDVLNKHNLTIDQVKISKHEHNNKVDVHYNGDIIGLWFTELSFKAIDEKIIITCHEWI